VHLFLIIISPEAASNRIISDGSKRGKRSLRKREAGGNPELIQAANEIEPLSYNQFRAIYLDGEVPGRVTEFGLDRAISVGPFAAKQYLGTRCDFWNFNLADTMDSTARN
jgi:hypothetical protein